MNYDFLNVTRHYKRAVSCFYICHPLQNIFFLHRRKTLFISYFPAVIKFLSGNRCGSKPQWLPGSSNTVYAVLLPTSRRWIGKGRSFWDYVRSQGIWRLLFGDSLIKYKKHCCLIKQRQVKLLFREGGTFIS